MTPFVCGNTTPYWSVSADLPALPAIDRDHDTDVVIVGGGLTGLTSAYLLLQAGHRVIVVERDRCASVDTAHTTAHLTMATDTSLVELASRFGRDHAQAVWDAGLASIEQIATIARAIGSDCGFAWVDGYLHVPTDKQDSRDVDRLRQEAQLAAELGFDVDFVSDVPFFGTPGVRFERQARFHPRRYLASLATAIVDAGGLVFERSAATTFNDDPVSVEVNGHTVSCRTVVLATHNPLVGLAGMLSASFLQTKLALYTSYVVAGRVPHGTIPDALFWDTDQPYRYLRLDRAGDHDVVIVGGEDHKTGHTTETGDCYERLARFATTLLPGVEIAHCWSGQVIETPDGLPYIGRTAEHQYIATGFGGNGMTFGTLSAMMIADAIAGRVNPWAGLFAPDRKALGTSLWDYVKENATYPYYLVRDRVAGVEGRSLRAVPNGEGRIVEYRGQVVAASRDESGALDVRSARCTHLGCHVAWNAAERTWDCPCHGSRFRRTGEVISGPAESPLPPVE